MKYRDSLWNSLFNACSLINANLVSKCIMHTFNYIEKCIKDISQLKEFINEPMEIDQ